MKVMKLGIVLAAAFCAFSAQAAKEVTQKEVDSMKLKSIGTISTTAETTAPIDARRKLSKMADEKGGRYYRVIAAREHGRISATAEVYK